MLPILQSNYSYPKIGIIDGGVSSIFSNWIEANYGFLSPKDRDEAHGTFIAGLVLSGKALNGSEICSEDDGCKIIDIDILPEESSFGNYYPNPLDLFNELEYAVKTLKASHDVRIFNFSLNTEEHVSSSGYSYPAKVLDKIAEENDVIFIISAGNTSNIDIRKEWSEDPIESLSILASSKNDLIKNPAESGRNLSVSALNPPNLDGIVPYSPSNYSCRGPGLRTGLKPDLAHIGGTGPNLRNIGHGLFSLNLQGQIVDGCGTSYACPQIAKTLACLDNSIEGSVSRESLIALAIHSASRPTVLKDKRLNDIAKHMVGFGMPESSNEILEGNDNSITLVFANRVYAGQKLSFNLTWPRSLIKEGKCYGYAKLTLVSSPPFDYSYGAEYVRVNVEGHLRQEQKKGGFLGKLNSIYTPENNEGGAYEENLIKHSLKWSPIKVYEKTFNGVGESSNWRLEIEHLTRDGEKLPASGVPFTAILTISDPESQNPVFDEMRKSLTSIGVSLGDIRTAARVVSRV